MKTLYIFIILFFTCTSKYDAILEGLSKNHVLLYNDMGAKDYCEAFNSNEETYLKDKQIYNESVKKFFNSNPEIIDYLLKYEHDTLSFSNWIHTRNPYSSIIRENDLMTNSKGALFLIDNYLSQNDRITIPPHYKKLSYVKFKKFYKKNKNLNKEYLKKEYKNFLENL